MISGGYWWAEEDPRIIVSNLEGFRLNFRSISSNPICQAWYRNICAYYSPVLDAGSWESSLGYEGQQGELVRMIVPQAKSLINQMVALFTKEKLAFSAIAEKEGEDVIQEARIGDALANQIVKNQRLEEQKRELSELALVTGLAWYHPSWRTDKGQPWIPDESGAMLWTGELEISIKSIFDMTYNPTIPRWESQPYCEVRTKKNRWDLVAQFPELAERLKGLARVHQGVDEWSSGSNNFLIDDIVYIYEAYHVPCPALPEGRMVIYGDQNTILYDGPNLYGCLPPEPMRPEGIFETQYGFPFLSSLLPCQEMFDHNLSSIATTHAAFAVPTVLNPSKNGVSVTQIAGMNWVNYSAQPGVPDGGKPSVLNLCQTPREVFEFAGLMKQHMQEISNLNSAIRGEPPPGVNSGKALATLTVNALEFMSSFAGAYANCHEATVTKAVNIYKNFAKIPRPLEVSTRQGALTRRPFTGKDLSTIQGVRIHISNPMMQTITGRIEVADRMHQMGKIRTSLAYYRVLEGAPMRETFAEELAEADLIESEKSMMLSGKPVQAIATDLHPQHMIAHKELISNADVRQNNRIVQLVLNHIMQHYELSTTTPPDLQQMLATGVQNVPALPPAGGGGPMKNPSLPPLQEEGQTPADDALGRKSLGGEL